MLSRLFFLKLFFIGAFLSGYAQTVDIKSPSEVCLKDVITFEPVITGTASGYSWAFGDNATSTQRITSHTYYCRYGDCHAYSDFRWYYTVSYQDGHC